MVPWGQAVVELYFGLLVGTCEEGQTLLLSPQERIFKRNTVFPFGADISGGAWFLLIRPRAPGTPFPGPPCAFTTERTD